MRKRTSPKRQRLVLLLICAVLTASGVGLILTQFSSSLVYFYSPSDLAESRIEDGRIIRVGGLVATGSLEKNEETQTVRFLLTDTVRSIPVAYTGLLPGLFREGQGVVAEGTLESGDMLRATTILAKHDERYMPPEVADALKRSGRWQEQAPP